MEFGGNYLYMNCSDEEMSADEDDVLEVAAPPPPPVLDSATGGETSTSQPEGEVIIKTVKIVITQRS